MLILLLMSLLVKKELKYYNLENITLFAKFIIFVILFGSQESES